MAQPARRTWKMSIGSSRGVPDEEEEGEGEWIGPLPRVLMTTAALALSFSIRRRSAA